MTQTISKRDLTDDAEHSRARRGLERAAPRPDAATPTSWSPSGAFAPLVLALLACVQLGCQQDPERRQHEPAPTGAAQGPVPQPETMSREGLEGGELVFEDDFEAQDGALSSPWRRHPKARVEKGWLHLENIKNVPPVWLNKKLPEKVRIEFDARALTPEGDVKVEVFGDGQKHESGYILVHGAHKNAEDWMARLGEHNDDALKRPSRRVEPNRVYHWSIVRTDGNLRWFIDGEPFMEYPDPSPLKGAGHRYFAFNNWTAPVEFDNVKIYDLGP